MSAELAFEQFVRQHTPTLFSTAFLLTGDRYRAEELLQDTLVRLYPKWSSVAGADAPVAYVRRSIANRYVSMRRSPQSRAMALRSSVSSSNDSGGGGASNL